MLGVKDASGSTGKKRAEDGSQAKGRDETRGISSSSSSNNYGLPERSIPQQLIPKVDLHARAEKVRCDKEKGKKNNTTPNDTQKGVFKLTIAVPSMVEKSVGRKGRTQVKRKIEEEDTTTTITRQDKIMENLEADGR
ncbi:hypothetical protein ASPFODRAFT_64583 [Aspergillus luchuensis CBS 106.47]|uniref:Uncharacterized protein n=1 Tax=Aspergillus luchuensis (strain CBS 106.47) TaxID=1137211 RepID=A0A1M3T4W8_ASPLC|nr:hypothetical protein ASPFODRAFT_64583 [Aspergillus luchuensis CBS 106.47]